jgi:uncharacterized protein (DUF362 family)
LVDDVALFISLYDCWLNMIEIIDSVLHVKIVIDLNVLRVHHFFVVRHI